MKPPELENGVSDSTSNRTQGMYFELDNKYTIKDSTLSFSFGYRYVDPNFRSVWAQTRRLDYNNINSIYPTYTNMSLIRPPLYLIFCQIINGTTKIFQVF